MKKILMVLVICLTGISLHADGKFKEGELPEKMVVLSQTGDATDINITGVDLENNELIYIRISYNKYFCYRTGITIDMSKQKAIEGTSSSSDDE